MRSSWFPARYSGRCGGCGDLFEVNAAVTYNADDVLVGQECCGDELDEPQAEATEAVAPDKVMPRGKTVRDRCGRCFQVPASNGVCGCW